MTTQFDVLIIGAGLSGIGTACQLAEAFPQKRMAILERRESIGGTWDLFRYPGIRSDSDMASFGFKFRPWNDPKVLADGEGIRNYIRETAREYGVEQNIHFGLKTTQANWCSRQRHWTVTALHEASGETRNYTAKYLISCTGYYNHDKGFLPNFPGVDNFKGQCIHPQHWPENLDYSGNKVVVIGSGATAVTLVPAMAGTAAHVTMLQRSPSYVFSLSNRDKLSDALAKFLPTKLVHELARKRNILIQRGLYESCKRWPQLMRKWLLSRVRKQIGPNVDMRHFTPNYMPWDERLCAVPDGDLFKALRSGQASVVTDQIETFTETGIRLKSGQQLDADIIITATGLNLQMLGGMQLSVDNVARPMNQQMTYKGVLVQNLPNMAWIFGYTNAPWTLKSDLAGAYLCRLMQHMDDQGLDVAVPRDTEDCALDDSIMGALRSGYVQRAKDTQPRQGSKLPWRVLNDFGRDTKMLLEEPIDDGVLCFESQVKAATVASPRSFALAA
ncbi:MAG: NAD(P)/FAD-dependent oxidoreductase [Pseudomonadota bacterium]|nr:NAD(P)/FAD-dependent oxidoreductase [Pseudomonadota bacterium]